MKRYIGLLVVLICLFSSCSNSWSGGIYNTGRSKKKVAPSGKYRNPTIFSRVNPFQGKAKARLTESKQKKKKVLKRKHRQTSRYRKFDKPGRSFGNKRTISKKRIKSSGSRSKSRGGGKKSNKNLFNTRKK